ncbi:MAG: hypothetical protein QXQ18_01775 [Candidatus Aenigmatarchaeota archaeon]
MNIEKIVTIIFSSLGFFSGFLSYYFTDFTFSISLPLLIYFIVQFIVTRIYKHKKVRNVIYTGFMAFVLIWLVTWIFLFNLKI